MENCERRKGTDPADFPASVKIVDDEALLLLSAYQLEMDRHADIILKYTDEINSRCAKISEVHKSLFERLAAVHPGVRTETNVYDAYLKKGEDYYYVAWNNETF